MLDRFKGNGLLIHHWDTDGICSARLILEYFNNKNIINKTPILGNYYLTDEELNKYSRYDYVVIVDMSLPRENILTLSKNAKVVIFDHHLGTEIKEVLHYNPIIKGGNPEKYPSTSCIVNDFFDYPVNLFSLLGIIGDHEEKIKSNKIFYKIISNFLKKEDISFKNMIKMSHLLDTNYKIDDKKAVEKAPIELLHIKNHEDILNNEKWNRYFLKLNKEISNILSKPKYEKNGIIIEEINTSYNIISTITRRIAWDSKKNTIVINKGFFTDRDQIYMRCSKNAEPIIEKGKNLGYKCGGKREVFGAIIPKDKTDSFVNEIIDFLT
jgi:single-stranded DNA-specific DHH superfamily exonuclease